MEKLNAIISLLTMSSLFVFLCVFLAYMLITLVEKAKKINEKILYEATKNKIREIGKNIKNESHWMSESREAMIMMECIGEYLRDNGWYLGCADSLRKKYRERVKESINV